MLWFRRKRLVGSYHCFNATKRSRLAPEGAVDHLIVVLVQSREFMYSAPVANGSSARNAARPHSRAASSSSGYSQLDSMPSRNGADRSLKAVSEAPAG